MGFERRDRLKFSTRAARSASLAAAAPASFLPDKHNRSGIKSSRAHGTTMRSIELTAASFDSLADSLKAAAAAATISVLATTIDPATEVRYAVIERRGGGTGATDGGLVQLELYRLASRTGVQVRKRTRTSK